MQAAFGVARSRPLAPRARRSGSSALHASRTVRTPAASGDAGEKAPEVVSVSSFTPEDATPVATAYEPLELERLDEAVSPSLPMRLRAAQAALLRIAPRSFLGFLALWLPMLGAVPITDIAFALAFPIYIFAINKLRFKDNAGHETEPPKMLLIEGPTTPWFKPYLQAFGVVTFILPLLTAFVAPWLSLSPQLATTTIVSIAPPIFLLVVQLLCEAATSYNSTWAALPRLLVPIGFNTYRLLPLFTWVAVSWQQASAIQGAGVFHSYSLWCAALAATNLVMWTFNLFYFLMLIAVPSYLDKQRFAV